MREKYILDLQEEFMIRTDRCLIDMFAVRKQKLWFILFKDRKIGCVDTYLRAEEYLDEHDRKITFKVIQSEDTQEDYKRLSDKIHQVNLKRLEMKADLQVP